MSTYFFCMTGQKREKAEAERGVKKAWVGEKNKDEESAKDAGYRKTKNVGQKEPKHQNRLQKLLEA